MRLNTRFAFVIVLALAAFGAFVLPAAAQTDADAHRDVIVKVIDSLFNQADPSYVEQTFPADYVAHPDNSGKQDLLDQVKIQRAAMPDLHAVADMIVVEGDYAAFRLTTTGTFTQPLVFSATDSIPPNNAPLHDESIIFVRFNADGQPAEEWDASDQLGTLQQLGIIPPMDLPMMATPAPSAPMPEATASTGADHSAANKATIQHLVDDIYNKARPDLFPTVYAEGYVRHSVDGDQDIANFGKHLSALAKAMPDAQIHITVQVAEGDWVATYYDFVGTYTGEYGGLDGQMIKGKGQKVDLQLGVISHFNADGKIDEDWELYDRVSLWQQLGLIPSMEPPTEAAAS